MLAGCQERPAPQPRQSAASTAPYQPGYVEQPAAAPELDDGSGFYIPRTRIDLGTIDRDSIVAFSLLDLASIVKADYTGRTQVTQCRERVATQDTLHLVCIDPVLGTVRIDGHFLVPRVEHRVLPPAIDADLVDAMVTVTRNGRVRYAQRHRFFWSFGE